MRFTSNCPFYFPTDKMMRSVTFLSHGWFHLTLQRTKFLQMGVAQKFSFHITHGHVFAFCLEKVARYFQKALYYTTDISLLFFKYRRRKMSPLPKKWGHHDLRILGFERIASTTAVRTRGDFGSIPSHLLTCCFRLRISARIYMRTENAAAFEKNIAFFCSRRYNRYIPKTKGVYPCQDRHGAVGFVAHHKLIPSAPTGARIPSRSC